MQLSLPGQAFTIHLPKEWSPQTTELQGQGTDSIFRGSHRIRALGTYMSLGPLGAGWSNSLQSWKMQTDNKTTPEKRKVTT